MPQLKGSILKASPYTACGEITNAPAVRGQIALVLRGGCMFAAKARRLQAAGAIGVIFIGERLPLERLLLLDHRLSLTLTPSVAPADHHEGSNSEETPLFQMVGDGDPTDDIRLPLVFLFSREGATLTAALEEHQNVDVLLLPKQRQLERGEEHRSAPELAASRCSGFLRRPFSLFSR